MSRIIVVTITLIAIAAGAVCADQQTTKLEHRALTDNGMLDKLGNPSMMICTPAFGLLGAQGNPPDLKSPIPLYFVLPDPKIDKINSTCSGEAPVPQLIVVLDRPGGEKGSYDTLYTNFAALGDTSGWKKIEGKPADVPGGGRGIDFGVIAIPRDVPAHGAAHLRLWAVEQPGCKPGVTVTGLHCCPGCYMEGRADLGGTVQTVRILDSDLDGRFDGFAWDQIAIGDDAATALTETLIVNNRLYTISPAGEKDVSSILFSDYADPTGTLLIRPTLKAGKMESFGGIVTGEKGSQIHIQSDGTGKVILPVSGWDASGAILRLRDGDATWLIDMHLGGRVDIRANEETVIDLGKSVRAVISIEGDPRPGARVNIWCVCLDAAGDRFDEFTRTQGQESRNVLTQVVVKDAAGNVLTQGDMSRG